MRSGNDVGCQTIGDAGDLVLEHQLALFQALDLQLIGCADAFKRENGIIKIAMFLTKYSQLIAERLPLRLAH